MSKHNFVHIRTLHLFLNSFNQGMQARMAHEAAYLGISVVEVSEPLFKLFKRNGVMPSQDELWKARADHILALPDPGPTKTSEQLAAMAFLKAELVHLFQQWVRPDQIVFKELPPGNTKVIITLPAHFVIDLNLLGINNVHKALAADEGACARQAGDCNCTRELLVQGMMDAISARPGGPSTSQLQRALVRQYQAVTKERIQNLGPGLLAPEIPVPGAAVPQPKPNAAPVPGSPNQTLPTSSGQPTRTGDSSERPIVIEEGRDYSPGQGEAPRPTDAHPIIHHTGLRSDIEKVLWSAPPAGARVSVDNPADGRSASNPTVLRTCKHRVRSDLVRCSLYLGAPNTQVSQSAFLYLPQGASERDVPGVQIQELFNLLTRLHRLFASAPDAFQLYYCPGDGIIAFNKGDRLWYNAGYDQKVTDKGARAEYWYHIICHELAHHYVRDHDTFFSQYVGKITLEYGKAFYAFVERL
jgi:hypothetical protein